MKFAQLVIGPAGSGKSTYCYTLQEHCRATGRTVHIVNLDPAAEFFRYEPTIDVRDLITVEDAMDELELGPNGALIYCLEYLEEQIHEWLADELAAFGEDEYIVIDCPGQIELFTHIPVLRTFVDFMRKEGWNTCAVYCIDSHFVTDSAKFIAGCFQALAAMVTLEVAHVNVLTKVDLLEDKDDLEETLNPDKHELLKSLTKSTGARFRELNEEIAKLVDGYGMVAFTPLDITDEDSAGIDSDRKHVAPSLQSPELFRTCSIATLLLQIDMAIQYGEDLDTNPPDLDV